MMKIKVWLDDIRVKPPKFDLHCHTSEEVIELIKQNKVESVSLDNDLGEGYSEGKIVAQFIEQAYYKVKLILLIFILIRAILLHGMKYWHIKELFISINK